MISQKQNVFLCTSLANCAADIEVQLKLEGNILSSDKLVALAATDLTAVIKKPPHSGFNRKDVALIRTRIESLRVRFEEITAPDWMYRNLEWINERIALFNPDGSVSEQVLSEDEAISILIKTEDMQWMHDISVRLLELDFPLSPFSRALIREAASNVFMDGNTLSGQGDFFLAIRCIPHRLIKPWVKSLNFFYNLDRFAPASYEDVPLCVQPFWFATANHNMLRGPIPDYLAMPWMIVAGIRRVIYLGNNTRSLDVARKRIEGAGLDYKCLPLRRYSMGVERLDELVQEFLGLVEDVFCESGSVYISSPDDVKITGRLLAAWRIRCGSPPDQAMGDEIIDEPTRVLLQNYYGYLQSKNLINTGN